LASSIGDTGSGVPRRGFLSRALRFAAGLLVGAAFLPGLFLLDLGAAYALSSTLLSGPRGDSEMRGADVSAAGGVRLDFSNKTQALHVVCRDTCDDLTVNGNASGEVEVRDVKGRRIVGRERTQFPSQLLRAKAWLIEGRPLTIREGGWS